MIARQQIGDLTRESIKKIQMEIIKLKNTVTKMKNSPEELNSRFVMVKGDFRSKIGRLREF